MEENLNFEIASTMHANIGPRNTPITTWEAIRMEPICAIKPAVAMARIPTPRLDQRLARNNSASVRGRPNRISQSLVNAPASEFTPLVILLMVAARMAAMSKPETPTGSSCAMK